MAGSLGLKMMTWLVINLEGCLNGKQIPKEHTVWSYPKKYVYLRRNIWQRLYTFCLMRDEQYLLSLYFPIYFLSYLH